MNKIQKVNGIEQNFNIKVRLGKPIDILSLKCSMVEDFNSFASHVQKTRTILYGSDDLEHVDKCPICGSSSKNSEFRLEIYKAVYHQCSTCSHYFIINRPSKDAIETFYLNDTEYASTYTDKKSSETRLNQVAIPKAKWMIEQFESVYGYKPKSILDVGAGAGHFVHACKQLGMDAAGIELSKEDRQFCKKNFNVELKNIDFLKDWKMFSDVDIVTFWGVIEHTVNPVDFLKTAKKVISNRNGLVVAEVPRWSSFSTALQMPFHLDPLGHINVFTDDSFLRAFKLANLTPVSSWYFGMDAFSLVMHLSRFLNDKSVMDKMKKHLPILQDAIDQNRFSDEMVIAGKPDSI